MTRLTFRVGALSLVVALGGLVMLGGCGDKEPARPASVTPEMADTFEAYIVAFEKLATDLGAPGMSCLKAVSVAKEDGAAVTALSPRGATLREAMKAMGSKDPAARDWFAATYEGRMRSALMKFGTLVALCKDDPALKLAMNAVMSQFPMMKKKQP